jgi:hypothetical protein
MRSIRVGKQNSDFMVVAIHAHQNSFSYQAYSHDNSTPDFLVELAHKAIDNGADVFVGHGVHTLRGVEIYKPEQAQRILKLVHDLSKPFGTTISIENNVGVIHVAQTGTKLD